MCQIHGLREGKEEGDIQNDENETEIDFVLTNKEHRQFIQNVKAIPGEFQHALVIADIAKKKIRKLVRRTCAKRRRISLLREEG